MFSLQYTKLSIIIKDTPPYFIGSQLRGVLGHALKKVTCINPSYQCNGCFATSNCIYYEFYEEKNIFHKYRFDFELAQDYYNFNFYLFDNATDKLPYIISAFNKALKETGLGSDNKTYKEFDIYINNKNIINDAQFNIPKDYIQKFKIDKVEKSIKLRFITPLRIKKANRFIRDNSIELEDIIKSIYQRALEFTNQDRKKIDFKIEGDIISKNLNYKELTRKSNRQKTTMNLGGIMGYIEIKGLNRESFEMLKLGELIGIGKSTVMGLGKIKIEEI